MGDDRIPALLEELMAAVEEHGVGDHATEAPLKGLLAEIARLRSALEAAERGQRDALHDLGIELGARREAEARAEAAERERDDLKIIVVPSLGERLTSAEAAVERLTRERNAQNVLTCVYCGQEYPPGSPTHGASVLTEHIKVCTKHPLRQAEAALAAARAEAGAAYAKGVEAAIQKVREMVESSEEGDPWWAILDEAARALAAGGGKHGG